MAYLSVFPCSMKALLTVQCFNKDSNLILTWSDDNTARLWGIIDNRFTSKLMMHDSNVNGAVFNKDETRILTWTGMYKNNRGTARLWDAADGSPVGQTMKHNSYVDGAIFNKDETKILTRTWGGVVRLWDTADCSTVGQPMKHGQICFWRDFQQGPFPHFDMELGRHSALVECFGWFCYWSTHGAQRKY